MVENVVLISLASVVGLDLWLKKSFSFPLHLLLLGLPTNH